MTATDLIRLATELAECGGVHRFNNLVAAASHVLLEHERRCTVEAWEDGPEVGVGMSDKVGRVDEPECPKCGDPMSAWSRCDFKKCPRRAIAAAPSRAPEREEASGRCVEAPEGRGAKSIDLQTTRPKLYNDCTKCSGYGWVWGHELDQYTGSGDPMSDDTKYTCDQCHGVMGRKVSPAPGLHGGPPGYPCHRPAQGNLANPDPLMTLNGERKPLPQSDCQGEYPSGGISHDPDSKVAADFAAAQSDFGRRLVPRHMPRVNPELTDGDGA